MLVREGIRGAGGSVAQVAEAGQRAPLAVSDLLQMAANLANPSDGVADAERINRIEALERIKAAAAAAQAREIGHRAVRLGGVSGWWLPSWCGWC